MPGIDFLVEVPRIAAAFEIEVSFIALSESYPLLPVLMTPGQLTISKQDYELHWYYNTKEGIEAFLLGGNGFILHYSPTEGISSKPRRQARQHAEQRVRGCYRLGLSIEKLEGFFAEPLLTQHQRLQFRDDLMRRPTYALDEEW